MSGFVKLNIKTHMAIQLRTHPPKDGEEQKFTDIFGVSSARATQLDFVLDRILQNPKGTWSGDIITLARECHNNEEYTYALFRYGTIVGKMDAYAEIENKYKQSNKN